VFERRLYANVDGKLLSAVVALSLIGLVMIFSTTYDAATEQVGSQFYRQLGALLIGLVALVASLTIDYRTIVNRSLLIYGGLAACLLYTLWFGVEQGGAQRWIGLGLVNFQPSEFGRLVVALVLAYIFAKNHQGSRRPSDWLIGIVIVGLPVFLIARQPDLGTAVTLLPVCIVIMLFAGLKLRVLAVVSVVAILAAPVVWAYGMEDYQKTRIASFLDPEQDPRGAGYQQIQARITVGSGGLTGRGFLQGTQSQYDFLPVAHNDFIFSVLAEEHGFIGVLFTLGLYLFVVLRSLEAARLSKDRMGQYLVAGVLAGFTFQVIYNVTMSAGLAPVKGLPLPLMSYGGSSVIATLLGFGLILNVRMRRFTN